MKKASTDKKLADLTNMDLDITVIDSKLEKDSRAYFNRIQKLTKQSGVFTEVDSEFYQIIKDCFRAYQGLKNKIGDRYVVQNRFGEEVPHSALPALIQHRVELKRLLQAAGLTPDGRENKIVRIQVAHGNAHKTSTLKIINGE